MCGLAGLFDTRAQLDARELEARAQSMANAIIHRGPDDSGVWADAAAGIALGFRRLAIVDLTEAGHQPMISASGRYVMAFNGEVYNYEQIRSELQEAGLAPRFHGHSDTEVMLAAFEAWGPESAVQRFVGMFAFALWDGEARSLRLCRDRLGVKPLYYSHSGGRLLFGSELKALLTDERFDSTIDRNALALMLRYNYIPAPHTIYSSTRKLNAGCILTFREGQEPEETPYWSALQAVRSGLANPFTGGAEEAVERLDLLLRDSIALRMVADVPLGVFLSGGIDSSVVTALMQAQSPQPVRTFTIGFSEDGFDEAHFAEEVARRLGTDHTALIVSPQAAMDVIPSLPHLYDEPFADSSQIPTALVSALARKSVTVALSGDGGDELFAGYNRYAMAASAWSRLGRYPAGVRGALGGLAERAGTGLSGELLRQVRMGGRNAADMLSKAGAVVKQPSREALYHALISLWKDPTAVVLGASEPQTALTDPIAWSASSRFIEQMAAIDAISYLPDDILVKVDRASMGVSLEAREPLLDHRLFEYAWTLPLGLKSRDGSGKWVLKEVLSRYVPRELFDRPKTGFSIPLALWLRGPLREWAEDLLSERKLREGGYLDPKPIRLKWEEHLSGRNNWHHYLWSILMFQAWLEAHGAV